MCGGSKLIGARVAASSILAFWSSRAVWRRYSDKPASRWKLKVPRPVFSGNMFFHPTREIAVAKCYFSPCAK